MELKESKSLLLFFSNIISRRMFISRSSKSISNYQTSAINSLASILTRRRIYSSHGNSNHTERKLKSRKIKDKKESKNIIRFKRKGNKYFKTNHTIKSHVTITIKHHSVLFPWFSKQFLWLFEDDHPIIPFTLILCFNLSESIIIIFEVNHSALFTLLVWSGIS